MSTSIGKEPKSGIRGVHVLTSMLVFFAVIIAADSTMIYQALSTFGGVDDINAYRDGIAYNQRIARAEAQALTGWQDTVETLTSPRRLRVTLRGRDGAGVNGKKIIAEIGRPATNRFDHRLELEETSLGIYDALLPAEIGAGTWVVDVSIPADEKSDPAYQTRRRLWIAP